MRIAEEEFTAQIEPAVVSEGEDTDNSDQNPLFEDALVVSEDDKFEY